MAAPPEEHRQQEQEDDDSDEFTFPTPPPQLLAGGARRKDGRRVADFHHLPCSASASSSPPLWLLSSPIRRSFSAADCAVSPWRDRVLLSRQRRNGACSPALSDYAGYCVDEEEEEERMDSLWEDLNDEDAAARKDDLFPGSLDMSRRRSVAGPDAAERARRAAKDPHEAAAAVLGASRSSRRRPPGLVVMMRALRRMFVAHKGKSRVHRDEQTAASASASSCSNPFNKG
ncbi:hypothetical protein GQ55_6G005900 [Panicum hallii var. hallii]|uniref:Uncharacterized protein n=1 Tax=Panicum hallii var. hallii TaxID=1504633 RepID=A0A2T7D2G1_9POAL|nr:hypothetical protein GQ55_6G005900 [Panicum hallii var. hallii]